MNLRKPDDWTGRQRAARLLGAMLLFVGSARGAEVQDIVNGRGDYGGALHPPTPLRGAKP